MVFFGFHLNCEAYKIGAKQSEEAEELEDTQGYMEMWVITILDNREMLHISK